MKKAIYYRLIALTFIAIAIYGVTSSTIATINNQNQIKSRLTNLTLSTAELYNYNSDISLLSQAAGNNRVTIISSAGEVLADSAIDHETIQNRADREEVIHATRDAVFISIRTSYTLGEQFMYATILMTDGNILRLAYNYPGLLHNLMVHLPAILVATFVALVLSLFLASKFTNTIINPLEIVMNALSKRDYTQLRNYKSPYQEVNKIMQSIEPLMQQVTSEKLLEKQKRDFFSNASHELKTPITSILGFSEMINQDIIKTEAEKDNVLKRIETEARRMSELINELLMVSNLESKNMSPRYTDFNLKEVLQEAVEAVSPISNNGAVQVYLDAHDMIVYANKRQLYEMCVNLIENAVKYNKSGGEVSVELKSKKYNAILKVKDTGIGIPLEYQARVFERFFRVDSGRDKKVGGSGLGLSIVKHIVNMYNGEISLYSRKDVGTTVQVSLPIVRREG